MSRGAAPSAFWYIGATLPGATREELEARGFKPLPLYVSNEDIDHPVWRSGLAPYAGTKTAEEIRATGKMQPRDGGFSFLIAPDGVLFEVTTNAQALPSLSHMRFQHEEPLCAMNWYVANLGMVLPRMIDSAGRPMTRTLYERDCEQDPGPASWPALDYGGALRQPLGVVRYATGSLTWYPNQCSDGRCAGNGKLVPTRGQPLDHIAFTIKDFDARVAHLRRRGVKFLLDPYQFGESRAVMIQDPDGLAIELIDGGGQLRARPAPPL
jgi:catechol 2,3-dioxygenase-like lactoylglutathione lyase family enzyme